MDKRDSKPKLKQLREGYQETRAPLGFAQRVTANLEPQKHPARTKIVEVLSQAWSFHKLAVVSSFVAVVIISFSIMKSLTNEQSELEIAKLEKPEMVPETRKTMPESQPEKIIENTQIENTEIANTQIANTSAKTESPVREIKSETTAVASISEEEKKRFFSTSQPTDDSSLAVLTDIAEWLNQEQEVVVPDITDLPDISDIDMSFETT